MSLRYPRPVELGQLGPGHNVVESSAGTGKTFLLEHYFVDLVLRRGIPAEQILVVTFTEKAAAELVLRVRRLLHRLAELRPDHELATAAASASADGYWLIDDQAHGLLRTAMLACSRASIFTIHGFCQRVLREYAFAQRRLFDEELVDGKAVFGEALRAVLRGEVGTPPELRSLLEAWLASGETVHALEKLLRDCSEQHAERVRPSYNEAQLAQVLAAWRPIAPDDSRLRQLFKRVGLHPMTSKAMLSRLALVSQIAAECAGAPLRFLARLHEKASTSLSEVLDKLSSAQADDELADLLRQVCELQAVAVPLPAVAAQLLLPVVQARATAQKRSAGHYDYDDMLALVAAALADSGPAGHDLLAALRDRYRHGLIDEFQDTDRRQWSIFRRIFVEAKDGRHGLTVVGDPKQAIYRFRGADVHTYLAARRALVAADARSLSLQVNYRATAPLIEATHLLFAMPGFFRQGSEITYDRPVTCGRRERALTSTTGQPEPPVVLLRLAHTPDGIRANQVRAATADAIAGEIRRLTDPASTLRLSDDTLSKRVALRDIFVLTFTNDESHTVGEALTRAGIRHAFYKLGGIFASPEAREIRDVLFALVAPDDRDRCGKALLTRFFGLDLPELAVLRETQGSSRHLRLLLELAHLARGVDVPTLLSALVERTGVLRRELWQGSSERRLTNIMHVLELLQAEWARNHATIAELALLLDSYVRGAAAPPGPESELQRLETDEDAVHVLTIHKAKGLEADVVFLFGGLATSHRSPLHLWHDRDGQRRELFVGKPDGEIARRVAEETEDEQSRLHYVALTRARYRLYLPHYPTQLKHFNGSYSRLQRVLDEVLAAPRLDTRWLFGTRWCDFAVASAAQKDEGPVGSAPRAMPADLLATPATPPDIAAIRRERTGFRVTSYSTVKHLRADSALTVDDGDAAAASAFAPLRQPDPDQLPGGAATGIFLHELLASVPLPPLAARPPLATWYETGVPLFERMCRRHGRPASDAMLAARLVHAAYATPVRLGERVIPGLASATAALREMEFLYPMPEPHHVLLGRPATSDAGQTWRIERGVVRGFVDFLFEHDGRVYLCDWKSDELADYDPALVARHCAEHYDVQARIYTLAVLRMFGIARPEDYAARWGGVVFCFLRGRTDTDDRRGIFFRKPNLAEVLRWERDMEGQAFWGLSR